MGNIVFPVSLGQGGIPGTFSDTSSGASGGTCGVLGHDVWRQELVLPPIHHSLDNEPCLSICFNSSVDPLGTGPGLGFRSFNARAWSRV